jgi:ABC-type Fe3+/spermidine/putrescine transport system ATPase subunit
MTVFENVAFSFRARGIGRGEARPAVERALALVGLDGFADRPATRLSGGQQQRVALARAIACDSKIVLFDEPLSNLDAQLRLQMRTELAELRRRLGFTAIYVTHDQEEAFSLSDRIIVMRGGRIEQEGAPQELHRHPRTRFVAGFFGMKNILPAEITPSGPQADLYAARLAPEIVLRALGPGRDAGANGTAIGFRPIDVELAADDERAADGIPGTVERMVFLGDTAQYHIRSGPIEICAQDRPRDELAEGRKVRWQVAPAKCVVLSE